MKTFALSIICAMLAIATLAQAPQSLTFQAVIRDGNNQLILNSPVGMRTTILQGSPEGTIVYQETYDPNPQTNSNGLITLEIGSGYVLADDFATIDWAEGPYFIKTEADPSGGTNYTITGTSQLLSVPYALHANNGMKKGTTNGEMLYWDGTDWANVAPGQEGDVLKFLGGKPVWKSITFTFNGLEYGVVTNPITGKTWLDRNLGALQVATSPTDSDSYGDLYQWGRGTDGHQIRTSGTTTTLSSGDTPGHDNFIINSSYPGDWRNPQNDNLWQGVFGINNPCPGGYRLPTEAEWDAERTSWSSNDGAGAFASPLKLPLAGWRYSGNGSLQMADWGGIYWSSTVNDFNAIDLGFDSSSASMGPDNRAFGFSVRCIKE